MSLLKLQSIKDKKKYGYVINNEDLKHINYDENEIEVIEIKHELELNIVSKLNSNTIINYYIPEKDNPELRDLFQELVLHSLNGILWYQEDNTGEIQIQTNIYLEILELLNDYNENFNENEIIQLEKLIITLKKISKEKKFISYI